MKLATYSKDGGTLTVDHVEDREIRLTEGSSMLEYIEHERNTERRHRGALTSQGLGGLVNSVRANGGCNS